MEEQPKVELKEMPSKEVLEAFLTQLVLGTETKIIFDYEEGVFRGPEDL